MHYCIHLFTKTLPTEGEIYRVLSPYNSERVYCDEEGNEKEIVEYQAFTWDWYQIGGRYHGRLFLKVDEDDNEYKWRFYEKEPREGRLFHSMLLKRIKENFPKWQSAEEDYWGYLGYLDKEPHLKVDGAKISDLLNNFEELGCFGFIDIDGKAYSRSSWNGSEIVDNPNFDEQYQQALKDRADCFLTVIDIHD